MKDNVVGHPGTMLQRTVKFILIVEVLGNLEKLQILQVLEEFG